MATYNTEPQRPNRINTHGRQFFRLSIPVGAVYIVSTLLYHNNQRNIAVLGAVLITGAYLTLITAWFGIIRKEMPTVFPGRFQRMHMAYGSEAMFQVLVVISFIIALFVL